MRNRLIVTAVAALLALTACSPGSLGDSDDGTLTLTFLVDNSAESLKPAEALAKGFTAANPDITIDVETGRRAARATTW